MLKYFFGTDSWDFTRVGLSDSVREFFVSSIKTILAAAIAATIGIILQRVHFFESHLNVTDHLYIYEFALLVGFRSLMSAFLKWVNTFGIAVPDTTDSSFSGSQVSEQLV